MFTTNQGATDEDRLKALEAAGIIEPTPGATSEAKPTDGDGDQPEKKVDTGTDPKPEDGDTGNPNGKQPTVDNPGGDDKDGKTPSDPKTPQGTDPERVPRNTPKKYIPLNQYSAEKKQHKEELDAKDTKIRELEELLKKGGDNKSPTEDEEYKELLSTYQDKYGIEEADMKNLMKNIQKSLGITPEIIENLKKISNPETTPVDNTELLKAESEHFDKEYKDFEPSLIDMVPEAKTASDDQKLKIKEFLDKKSHTKDFADKPLDFVAFKHRGEISKIIKDSTPKVPGARTADTSHPSSKDVVTVNAEFFKGKTSFEELLSLDKAEASKIVNNFDSKTYSNFIKWTSSYNNSDMTIERAGRRIKLV